MRRTENQLEEKSQIVKQTKTQLVDAKDTQMQHNQKVRACDEQLQRKKKIEAEIGRNKQVAENKVS